jgi:hypothetical protein
MTPEAQEILAKARNLLAEARRNAEHALDEDAVRSAARATFDALCSRFRAPAKWLRVLSLNSGDEPTAAC